MTTTSHVFDAAVDELHSVPFLLDALRSADDLGGAADHFGDASVAQLVALVDDATDTVTAIAAIHALSHIYDLAADRALSALLSDRRQWVREHATLSFAARLPRLDAIGRLVATVMAGGFEGALAQRTLEAWADGSPDHIALAIEGALAGCPADAGADADVQREIADSRARLAETLGLVPSALATRVLVALALDDDEPLRVRVNATAALGDRASDQAALRAVALLSHLDGELGDGELGDVARLAAYDIELALNPPTRRDGDRRSEGGVRAGSGPGGGERDCDQRGGASEQHTRGLTIAQLFLHADIDRHLTRAGAGDNGGIATLLVRLGDALARGGGVARVITMSRGSAAAALAALPAAPAVASAGDAAGGDGLRRDGDRRRGEHLLVPVPLLSAPTPSALSWPSRVAAERGIRRALLALGPVDVLHLRMADVGSLAAAAVAERLGIPVVFTLAPDPHAAIHALDMTGDLTRATFGAADEREHYWFRTRLVDQLTRRSSHTVLFPRPHLAADLQALLGIDIDEPGRYTAVAEGIDVSAVDAAITEARVVADVMPVHHDTAQRVTPGQPVTPAQRITVAQHDAFAELADLVQALPAARHGLPLAISVGRLHPVKGMAALVETWASDAVLRSSCNLLIVGGDLGAPSSDERAQLRAIEQCLAEHPDARAGLILPGNRPNATVARWLAATRFGMPGLVGARGIYVCASQKEEFGIALLEALATGLVVVAPDAGGPATYVVDRVTGVLVDTRDAARLSDALRAALTMSRINTVLELGAEQARIDSAQTLVRDRFTIGAMARSLTHIYETVDENRRATFDAQAGPDAQASLDAHASHDGHAAPHANAGPGAHSTHAGTEGRP